MAEQTTEGERQAARATGAATETATEGYGQFLALGRDNIEGLTRSTGALLDGTAELGRVWTGFWSEQLAEGLEELRALAACRSWDEALERQNAFLRASVERACAQAAKNAELTAAMIANGLKPLQENGRRAAG